MPLGYQILTFGIIHYLPRGYWAYW